MLIDPLHKNRRVTKLTKEQERTLRREERYAELIESVEPYIRNLLARQRLKTHDFEDCYQHVWVHLLRSCHGFNPEKGSLTTWTNFHTRCAARNWRNAQRLVRVPTNLLDGSDLANTSARRRFADAKVGYDEDALRQVIDRDHAFVEEERQREAELPEMRIRVARYLAPQHSMLTPRHKQVIALRMDGKTLQESGLELGITRERVRQLEVVAMRLLTAAVQNEPWQQEEAA